MYSGPPQPSSDAVVALDLADRRDSLDAAGDTGRRLCGELPRRQSELSRGERPRFRLRQPADARPHAGGRDLIVIGQKSGVGYALDPDKEGAVVWQYQAGQGGVLGGMEWGSARRRRQRLFCGLGHHRGRTPADCTRCCSPRASAAGRRRRRRSCGSGPRLQRRAVGGAHRDSRRACFRAPSTARCAPTRRRTATVLWEFDSNREFETVNGVPAKGASMIGPGPAVAGGMLYVNSGYGALRRPGRQRAARLRRRLSERGAEAPALRLM